jgi:hypothetical protein
MGKGTAYGSAMYLNYYRALYLIYFGVAILYTSVWASISNQCKGVCPVASFADLTSPSSYESRSGYDQTYLLPGIRWPVEQNASAGPVVTHTARNRLDLAKCKAGPDGDRCSDTVLPPVYTHYFSCNLTSALGEYWWDNISTQDQWIAASTAGAGQTDLAENQNYWGKDTKFVWESRKSACYVCCDPAHMVKTSKCRPSITSVAVYTFCGTSSECQSGFKPASDFPIPQNMQWATFQADILLILGLAYAAVGLFSGVIACGYSVYAGKYELDFKEDNLTLSDKCCGALAKNGPWLMRLINIGMLFLTIFQIYSLTTNTCFDGHDQFGNYGYFDTMAVVISFVSALFFVTCIAGTIFRASTDPDPAFYNPSPNPDPSLHGRSVIDLCCHDAYCQRPCFCCTEDPRDSCECGGCKCWAATCLIKRQCCWLYVCCGP